MTLLELMKQGYRYTAAELEIMQGWPGRRLFEAYEECCLLGNRCLQRQNHFAIRRLLALTGPRGVDENFQMLCTWNTAFHLWRDEFLEHLFQ